jgi:hypothetical protein
LLIASNAAPFVECHTGSLRAASDNDLSATPSNVLWKKLLPVFVDDVVDDLV